MRKTDSRKINRPWGWYKKIFHGSGMWIKLISVKSGHRLSLQKHRHRSEKWIVVEGYALVTLHRWTSHLREGRFINIPVGALHRMTAKGAKPLKFIELAYGDILREDDIVRVEDDYRRAA